MKNNTIDWKRKLTSRKFWMAVAGFAAGIITATGDKETAVVVAGLIMQGAAVVAYIIGEGLADSASPNTTENYYINSTEDTEEESYE